MHQIELSEVNNNEMKLTQAVLQVAVLLGIYHAELARILGLQCSDIGELYRSGQYIKKDTRAWLCAEQLIKIYEILYVKFSANETKIHNWLRKENKVLAGAPLYLMVDNKKLKEVLFCVNSHDIE